MECRLGWDCTMNWGTLQCILLETTKKQKKDPKMKKIMKPSEKKLESLCVFYGVYCAHLYVFAAYTGSGRVALNYSKKFEKNIYH
jgi:hypothetical protein